MTADNAILQIKYAGVIETFAKKMQMSYRTAMGIFYNSDLYQEMRFGISDMHCRSDEYLAEELRREANRGVNAIAQ
jgi:hypothetical protein